MFPPATWHNGLAGCPNRAAKSNHDGKKKYKIGLAGCPLQKLVINDLDLRITGRCRVYEDSAV